MELELELMNGYWQLSKFDGAPRMVELSILSWVGVHLSMNFLLAPHQTSVFVIRLLF
jgi:hypothetical protein